MAVQMSATGMERAWISTVVEVLTVTELECWGAAVVILTHSFQMHVF